VSEPQEHPSARDPDLEALEAFRAGDPAAFDRLVTRHERRIFRLACRILGDREAALDAAQETFVRAWRALARFQGASLFSTWLTRIAINQCRNELRRRRTAKHARPLSLDARVPGTETARRDLLPGAGPDGYEATRGSEVRRAFEAALTEVDPEDREVLVLREVEDLSYEGIAAVLDVAIGTVRSRLHRARTELRRRMSAVLDR
jgi:RNA polymerase sigma-70 factor (ECF subfamily)